MTHGRTHGGRRQICRQRGFLPELPCFPPTSMCLEAERRCGGEYTKVVEMYDTRTDTWVKKRDMPTRRKGFVTAVIDGKIYIIGGSIQNKKLGKREATGIVEVYDPGTNKWEKRASMPTEREWAKAEVVDGKVYVLGGEVSFAGFLGDRLVNAIEAYNPKTNTWRKRPDIPMPKCWFETAVVDNEIWTIGGYNPKNGFRRIDAVDVYNPTVNKWRKAQPLTIPKAPTAAVVNGTIYLLGDGWTTKYFHQLLRRMTPAFWR